MVFVRKIWQFRDIISENELNRMEDGIEEGITKAEQAQGDISSHVARADNPHGVTKDQVGLGNVQNYPVASQSEAEAGTASNRYMTPQRTKQAIDALSPVKSVNGKAGDVTLTASDVGAPTTQQHDQLEQKIDTHLADEERHITDTERNNWNNKVNKSGDSMTGNLTFDHSTGLQAKHVNGDQLTYFDLINFPDLTTESGVVRLFRFTNTTGEKRIELYPGDGTGTIQFGLVNGEVRYLNSMNLKITAGNGNPEGSVTANPGSIYLDRTNGKMYVKETGTGNTGWKVVQTV